MDKVLLVNDNPDSSRTIRDQLTDLNLVPVGAIDGDSALQYCKDGDYALMIVDLDSTATRGLFSLQRLRIYEPDLPVIVLSSDSSMRDLATVFRFGASDWLKKPVGNRALRSSIRRWVPSGVV